MTDARGMACLRNYLRSKMSAEDKAWEARAEALALAEVMDEARASVKDPTNRRMVMAKARSLIKARVKEEARNAAFEDHQWRDPVLEHLWRSL